METTLKLLYTPRSHFSRKVRILSAAMNIPLQLIDIGNVGDNSVETFGKNPLMKVPTLIDGDFAIYDSDVIAQYLVAKNTEIKGVKQADQFGVNTTDFDRLNLRTVMNGIMASEVELILAQRSGMDTSQYQRFDKLRESISNGLSWLESNIKLFPAEPNYQMFHLVCLWDHLVLYKILPLEYPQLASYVTSSSKHAFIAATAPM